MTIALETILEAVSKEFDVPPAIIMGWRRHDPVVRARAVAAYLCRELTGWSYSYIGQVFDKDHASIMRMIRKVEAYREDRSFDRKLQRLKARFLIDG